MRERGTRGQHGGGGRAGAHDSRIVDNLTAPAAGPGTIDRLGGVCRGTAAVHEDREPPRGGRHHQIHGAVAVYIPGRKGEHCTGIHLAPSYNEPRRVKPV